MKKLLVLCSIFMIAFFAKEADAACFVELFRNDSGVYSLDLDSLTQKNGNVLAWVKIIKRGKQEKVKGKIIASEIFHYAIKPDKSQYQATSVALYDKNGSMIDTAQQAVNEYRFEDIIPGTIGEKLFGIIIDIYEYKQSLENDNGIEN